MSRQALTDGSGSWFDPEAADHYDEISIFNGSNHISMATGTQFDHECIYRTKSGKYILHKYSQWQGKMDTFVQVSKEEAARWFAKQGIKDHPEELSTIVDTFEI